MQITMFPIDIIFKENPFKPNGRHPQDNEEAEALDISTTMVVVVQVPTPNQNPNPHSPTETVPQTVITTVTVLSSFPVFPFQMVVTNTQVTGVTMLILNLLHFHKEERVYRPPVSFVVLVPSNGVSLFKSYSSFRSVFTSLMPMYRKNMPNNNSCSTMKNMNISSIK